MSEYELADKFFPPEQGSAPEPGEEASEAEWLEWADSYEEALAEQQPAEQQVDALSYPQGEPEEFEPGPVAELRMQGLAEAFHADLAGAVRELAAGEGVRDEQAVERISSQILQAREQLSRHWLANGASVNQVAAALADLDLESAVSVGLQQERYRAVTDRDSSLRGWRAGREAQARQDAAAGRPARQDVMASPYIATLARRLAASAERQREWQQGVMESYKRQTGQR